MSKNKKKPLPKASSAKNKSTAKAAPKKAAKPAAKTTKPLVKALTGLAKALTGKSSDAKAKTPAPAKASKPVPAPAEVVAKPAKPAKKEKASKKKAKKGEEFDLEDDILADDDGMGSEDIPDLSEFDENVEEVVEDDETVESFVTAGENRPDDEVILTDAEGRRYCRVRDCDQVASVEAYCRYHYLLLWKRIQVRRKILADGKLEKYVEELTARYPDKFLEMIRRDLRTEKDFLAAIAELEIDESAGDSEFEDEAQSFVDEMRGITSESGMSDEEEF